MTEDKENIYILECNDCGTTKDVFSTYCPWEYEINGKRVEVDLCENCEALRCEEI